MVFTEEMRCMVDEGLGFVATVNADGTPNLSPKGTIAVWDDEHLVFADIASPNTSANLERNSAIEVLERLLSQATQIRQHAAVRL